MKMSTIKKATILLQLLVLAARFSTFLAFSPSVGVQDHSDSGEQPTTSNSTGRGVLIIDYENLSEIPATPRRLGTRFSNMWRQARWIARNHFGFRRMGVTAYEWNIIQAYERALSAIVELKVFLENNTTDPTKLDPELERQENLSVAVLTLCSGFLWDDQGHIVTNRHCVQDTDSGDYAIAVKARFAGSFEWLDTSLIGCSTTHDLAVLKILQISNLRKLVWFAKEDQNEPAQPPLKRLPKPIPKGSAQFLRVGQTSLAIGHPHGVLNTLSVGFMNDINCPAAVGDKVYYGCIHSCSTYQSSTHCCPKSFCD
jgi:S1-C subfamily serine protease